MIIHIIKKLYLTVEVPDSATNDDILFAAYEQVEKHPLNAVHDLAASGLSKVFAADEIRTPRLENEFYTGDWTEL